MMMRRSFIFVFLTAMLACCSAEAQEMLSWKECLLEAAKYNPDIIAANESVKYERASKAVTESGLFPQIRGSFSVENSMTTTASAASGTVRAMSDSYGMGISATQLLFDGFKTPYDVKAVSENIQAAQHSFTFDSAQVRYNLRSAFVNLLKAQALVSVSEEIVKIRRDSLELITLRYHSGLEHKGAMLTAEANVAQAQYEFSQALRSILTYQRQLNQYLGRNEFIPLRVKGTFEIQEPVSDNPDFESLAARNPSVLKAAAEKGSAAFGIRSAYANFSPELTASASFDKTMNAWPKKPRTGWDVGLGVSVPIFEGGLKVAQVHQAYASYRQRLASEKSIKDGAISDLQEKWNALLDSLDAVTVKQKILQAALERSKIAEAQYSIGFVSFDDWIIIQNELVNAKKAFLEAQALVVLTEAGWIRAKGETLEYAN
ncbi:MAG: TolC family protein [Candidatus Omnitrophica bacterium]|nr:TolC family protein [Candidatus Omnitrophota bacterium]